MDKKSIADEIIEFAYEKTNHLSDEEYCEALEEIASTLQTSADAKREEMQHG